MLHIDEELNEDCSYVIQAIANPCYWTTVFSAQYRLTISGYHNCFWKIIPLPQLDCVCTACHWAWESCSAVEFQPEWCWHPDR